MSLFFKTPKQLRTYFGIIIVVASLLNFSIIFYFHSAVVHEEEIALSLSLQQTIINDFGAKEKLPVISILARSGVNITAELVDKLPTWNDFTSMYGSEPKIIGLDTCADFQTNVSPLDAIVGPAGCYNTGTHLISDLMEKHCVIEQKAKEYDRTKGQKTKKGDDDPIGARTGMFDEIPWGKHAPLSWRNDENYRPDSFSINKVFPKLESDKVFPIVVVKDIFSWLGSMCRHSYGAQWLHSPSSCLNFNETYDSNIPLNELLNLNLKRRERKKSSSQGNIRFAPPKAMKKFKINKMKNVIVKYEDNGDGKWYKEVGYDSLIDLWQSFYGDYLNADFPRLIVRYEDLLLHSTETVGKICQCVGGRLINENDGVTPNRQSAKPARVFGKTSDLVQSILRYGSSKERLAHFSKGDLFFADENIKRDLMDLFQYSFPQIDYENEMIIQTPRKSG